jgi:hypothetical protein
MPYFFNNFYIFKTPLLLVILKVIMVITIIITVAWDVTPYSFVDRLLYDAVSVG